MVKVKPISDIEVKQTISENDKILILDSMSNEARLTDKSELKGDKGNQGVGIQSIVKTGTTGNVDTYTITFTDDTTTTFIITNGNDGVGITTITTSKEGKITTITINKTDGTNKSFQISDGSDGQDGNDGKNPEFQFSTTYLQYRLVGETTWKNLIPIRDITGDDGVGIQSITKTDGTGQPGTTDTYTITLSSGATQTFQVYNGKDGKGITSIDKTGTVGNTDTYTITYTDGTTSTFTITNGVDGDDGRGIVSIIKTGGTGGAGITDTYTITYTDNTTSTFNVYNGKDGEGTGDMQKSIYDPANKSKQVAFDGEVRNKPPLGIPRANLGQPSIDELALFQEECSNKTAFHPTDKFKISKSVDGGTTRTDVTENFTTLNRQRLVGGDIDSGIIFTPDSGITNTKYRFEFEDTGYCWVNTLYLYCTSITSTFTTKIIKKSNDSSSWVYHTDSEVRNNGYPMHIYMPFSYVARHPTGGGNLYKYVGVEIDIQWSPTDPKNFSVMRLQLWGDYPASSRNIYKTYEDKRVYFPNNIYMNTKLVAVVEDLANYYTKSQTYSKEEVNNLVSSFGSFEVVSELPTSGQKTNVIYLKGPIGSGADKYEEYIWNNNAWVKIGDTSVDLTPYLKKTDGLTEVSGSMSDGGVGTAFTLKQTKNGTTTTVGTIPFAVKEGGIRFAGIPTGPQLKKLDEIEEQATKNQTDTYLLSRANHTGTQAISTVDGLQTALDGKQATLVSGTNIKTVNNVSLLGSGNITTPDTTYNTGTDANITNKDTTAKVWTGEVLNEYIDGKVSIIPQVKQNSNYTLVLGDAGTHLYHDNATAYTRTIPSNASVSYPIGTTITFINGGSGNITIKITSDTMKLAGDGATGDRTLKENGVATATKVNSTLRFISGNGLS